MSFLKKILGLLELPPEEKAERERMQQEKAKRRVEEAKRWREEKEKKREEKRLEKERKKVNKLQKIERFFGPDPSMAKILTYSSYSDTFEYVNAHLLKQEERVLGVIQAEYKRTQKREIKGVLIASEEKLIFAVVKGNHTYIEEYDYAKMKGISLAKDGFKSKKLYIDYGRSRRKFDDIIDDEPFREFYKAVKEKIVEFRKKSKSNSKYKLLDQIASLKEKGILTEEEFQTEKKKLIN
ncbi:hypothetical protein [Fictibacillus phosphorivorans]|uniref:hypothetical protein n=1 Tax=Fictibacillus phosphorivorans TaxID=1221500 RepID=UPI00203AB945|nr:hypothetical protein [Fictibacillus phosphorivorans]MCM3718149.1 hypothetical protein [Fictibacillus phosphorivorans]MCM3775776.1 hypothetical protein [Fictibacillus phosphorivorans]